MARGTEEFDYDSVPKRGELYPAGYYKQTVESHEEVDADDGRKYFRVVGRITDVGKATPKFEGQMVYHTFYVGTDDDKDATDPATWQDRKNRQAQAMVELLLACGLVKKGRGLPPWKLIEEIDDAEFVDNMTTYVKGAKSQNPGAQAQDHKYYKVGDREPGLVGESDGTPARRAKREPAEEAPAASARAANGTGNGKAVEEPDWAEMDADDLDAFNDEHDLGVKLAKLPSLKAKRVAMAEAFAAASE